jgi:hypothetical protein
MKSVPNEANAYRLNISNHEMFLSNLVTLTALLVLGICVSAAAVSVSPPSSSSIDDFLTI